MRTRPRVVSLLVLGDSGGTHPAIAHLPHPTSPSTSPPPEQAPEARAHVGKAAAGPLLCSEHAWPRAMSDNRRRVPGAVAVAAAARGCGSGVLGPDPATLGADLHVAAAAPYSPRRASGGAGLGGGGGGPGRRSSCCRSSGTAPACRRPTAVTTGGVWPVSACCLVGWGGGRRSFAAAACSRHVDAHLNGLPWGGGTWH